MDASSLAPFLDPAVFYGLIPSIQSQILSDIQALDQASALTGTLAATFAAVVYYDSLICFPMESRYIWHAKFSLTKFLCIWIRVMACAIITYGVTVEYAPWTPAACEKVKSLLAFIPTIIVVPAHMLLLIRAYAVYKKRAFVLWVSLPFIALEIAMMVWTTLGANYVLAPFLHATGPCLGVGDTDKTLVYFAVTMVPDLQMSALVIFRCLKLHASERKSGLVSESVVKYIIEQNAGAWIVICIANVANVIYMGLIIRFNPGSPNYDFLVYPAVCCTALLPLHMVVGLKNQPDIQQNNLLLRTSRPGIPTTVSGKQMSGAIAVSRDTELDDLGTIDINIRREEDMK